VKSDCVDCKSCPHGKLRRMCVICNPCPHGNVKSKCKDCRAVHALARMAS
jgi:hypothetical protein